ncbi:hypothetical protein SLE2022_246850 [Rubroshorea leprosula]
MESHQMLEGSKSPSEESDRSEQGEIVSGGRSYECVFCKRGFTTAQALGGHMNIHRKDRAKTSKPSAPPKVDEKSYSYQPIQNHGPHYVVAPEVHTGNYQALFPSSSPGDFRSHDAHPVDDFYAANPWNSNASPGWSSGLSLGMGPSDGYNENKKVEEDELDLELRLGHDP